MASDLESRNVIYVGMAWTGICWGSDSALSVASLWMRCLLKETSDGDGGVKNNFLTPQLPSEVSFHRHFRNFNAQRCLKLISLSNAIWKIPMPKMFVVLALYLMVNGPAHSPRGNWSLTKKCDVKEIDEMQTVFWNGLELLQLLSPVWSPHPQCATWFMWGIGVPWIATSCFRLAKVYLKRTQSIRHKEHGAEIAEELGLAQVAEMQGQQHPYVRTLSKRRVCQDECQVMTFIWLGLPPGRLVEERGLAGSVLTTDGVIEDSCTDHAVKHVETQTFGCCSKSCGCNGQSCGCSFPFAPMSKMTGKETAIHGPWQLQVVESDGDLVHQLAQDPAGRCSKRIGRSCLLVSKKALH